MSNGTRNTWMAGLLVLGLGSGELLAYQELTPHAKALLSGDGSRAVLAAGGTVARNLSALVQARARQAAFEIVLDAVKGTSGLYRLAHRATGATESCSFTGLRCTTTAESHPSAACPEVSDPEGCSGAIEAAAAGRGEAGAVVADQAHAAFAGEADAPCATGCSACPMCPCPAGPARGSASAGGPLGWAGLARALVIIRV